jgi:hypothetical protein
MDSLQPMPQVAATSIPGVYDPPAGTYPYFSSSAWLQHVTPTVNPSSAAWIAAMGGMTLNNLQFAANSQGLAQDYTIPVYLGDPLQTASYKCIAPWGTCNIQGMPVGYDPRMLPESGGCAFTDVTWESCSTDAHLAIVGSNAEYDSWQTLYPGGGDLTVSWGGQCALSSTGSDPNALDECNATASGTPLTLGIIRVKDWLLAAQSGGVLPYAISGAGKCSMGYMYPAVSGDNNCAAGPKEGQRFYINLHDATINALPADSLTKALLRTLDVDHYGVIYADTNGGENGFTLAVESDLTYTQFGYRGPLVSQFVSAAQAAGWPGTTPANNLYQIPIPMPSGLPWVAQGS